jgi:hypothetical protein
MHGSVRKTAFFRDTRKESILEDGINRRGYKEFRENYQAAT